MNLRVLLVVNHLDFLYSHRKDLVNYLSDRFDVTILSGPNKSSMDQSMNKAESWIRSSHLSFRVIHNLILSFIGCLFYLGKYRSCVFISISSVFRFFPLFLFSRSNVFLLTGLGSAFLQKNSVKRKFYRFSFYLLSWSARKKTTVVVQNTSDFRYMRQVFGYENIQLVKGVGIGKDFDRGAPRRERYVKPVVQLLYLGRFVEDKGANIFLECVSIIKKRDYGHVDIEALVIGDVGYSNPSALDPSKLGFYGSEIGIKFLGQVAAPFDYLSGNVILVLPSKREGFSRTLLEAQMFGIPSVVSNCAGCRDVVKPFRSAYLIPGAIEPFVQAIDALIQNSHVYEFFSNNAKQNFDLNMSTDDYNCAMTDIIWCSGWGECAD